MKPDACSHCRDDVRAADSPNAVQPTKTSSPRYLATLATLLPVVVVDGSPPDVFAHHAASWPRTVVHVPVDADRRGDLNGKVAGRGDRPAPGAHRQGGDRRRRRALGRLRLRRLADALDARRRGAAAERLRPAALARAARHRAQPDRAGDRRRLAGDARAAHGRLRPGRRLRRRRAVREPRAGAHAARARRPRAGRLRSVRAAPPAGGAALLLASACARRTTSSPGRRRLAVQLALAPGARCWACAARRCAALARLRARLGRPGGAGPPARRRRARRSRPLAAALRAGLGARARGDRLVRARPARRCAAGCATRTARCGSRPTRSAGCAPACSARARPPPLARSGRRERARAPRVRLAQPVRQRRRARALVVPRLARRRAGAAARDRAHQPLRAGRQRRVPQLRRRRRVLVPGRQVGAAPRDLPPRRLRAAGRPGGDRGPGPRPLRVRRRAARLRERLHDLRRGLPRAGATPTRRPSSGRSGRSSSACTSSTRATTPGTRGSATTRPTRASRSAWRATRSSWSACTRPPRAARAASPGRRWSSTPTSSSSACAPTAASAACKSHIRARELRLDGTLNPNLAEFGYHSEARQYSGRPTEETWTCPFRPRALTDAPAPQRNRVRARAGRRR